MTPILYWIFYSHLWLPLLIVAVIALCAYCYLEGRGQYKKMVRDAEAWRRRQ